MITGLTQTRSGSAVTMTATSSLSGTAYYYWYQDGAYVGAQASASGAGRWTFVIRTDGSQSIISVLDSADAPDVFDPIANAPEGMAWPACRTLVFIRSLDPAAAQYRIEQQKNGGNWGLIGILAHDPRLWQYSFFTDALEDLADYAWRVTALDAVGNSGAPLSLGAELIVRTPDAPAFTATFNAGTTRVAFAA